MKISKMQRVKANMQIRQQDLRDRISLSKQLNAVSQCLEDLGELDSKLRKRRTLSREEQALYMTRLATMKNKMHGHLQLVRKVLPDLKAVTLSADDDALPSLTLTVLHETYEARNLRRRETAQTES